MGDYNGIGPEVILKSLSAVDLNNSIPVILGHKSVLTFYAERSGISLTVQSISKVKDLDPGRVYCLDIVPDHQMEIYPGSLSGKAGKTSMKAVEKGIALCIKQACQALVTAPISKEAIHKAGYTVPGHTEFLAEKTATNEYMMMLVSGNLRVGLATIHVPIRKVAGLLTVTGITRHLKIMHQSLQRDFGIAKPRIAVLGLNPHAGDGGVIGTEEQEIIAPALQKVSLNGFDVKGPFAADGFFGKQQQHSFDAILAMYHDQGLVPFKALTFGRGINFTAGLPIIRTSPDHGTAFDIAGLNRANEGSFTAAYNLAVQLAANRLKKNGE